MQGTGTLGPGDLVRGDGTYADLVTFTATKDGSVEVTMTSSGNSPVQDPYVLAYRGTAPNPQPGNLIGEDDDGGSGNNAKFTFHATIGQGYTAVFNVYIAGDVGTYSYRIREV